MKKWLKTVFIRTGDLIVKLISVKTLMACVATYLAVKNPSNYTASLSFLGWALMVGFRYAEKVAGLIKKE